MDRILGDAKVGDLPVQFPTMFEMVVNLKIKALGLVIPRPVLAPQRGAPARQAGEPPVDKEGA